MVSFYRRLLLTLFILIISQTLETTKNIWQSIFDVSNLGLEFSPADEQALLLLDTTARSLLNCAQMCEMIARCRTFNYDMQMKHCRLYQGDIDSTGEVAPSASSQSVCGSIKLIMENFADYGGPCSICDGSRYLTCMNSTCHCQPNTFFNGSMCRSQKLIGGGCTSNNQCRNDLNLKCLLNNQCGSVRQQQAQLVAVHQQQAQLVAVHQQQAQPLVLHQLQAQLLVVHPQQVRLLAVRQLQVKLLAVRQLQVRPLAVHQQQVQLLAVQLLQAQLLVVHQQQLRPLAVQQLQAQLPALHQQQAQPLAAHQLQVQPPALHQQQVRPLAVQLLQAQLLVVHPQQVRPLAVSYFQSIIKTPDIHANC
ncbi:unnamed protein product [Adineta steineri]|uniref:Apple domain-containing protein n=1 Tax=Adineta steineri TaxID=433720 RepID=A0A815MXW5_9BILA|nr:unnamed protein product [Adineta steineri]